MDKLINIEDIYYILINNITDNRLLKDIINFKDNNDLNIKKLPLKAVVEILDTYKIKNKEEIINKLIKEENNEQ